MAEAVLVSLTAGMLGGAVILLCHLTIERARKKREKEREAKRWLNQQERLKRRHT